MQIGIDLGATKIESIVLDDKGQELHRSRENSPSNYLETIDSINLIVNKIEKKFNKNFRGDWSCRQDWSPFKFLFLGPCLN